MKKLKRFGRYLLLDHLVDGGMAKICRARFLSDDADKIVAIKMIQSQFSKDENFKKMFLDEIKVTFGLIHPNIAQTYDYGLYQSQLYTAMEYVDGANLKQFLDRLKQRNFVFPVEISAYIISQVCLGLSYAHNFRDKLTDKKLSIIHRDISPHNVMITFDGAVKIIDFGIAKSNTNSENTQAGTIKGKLSYLAPEYLEGTELDPRYDQFAVGITLWELLCSRKLFHSKNELAVLKLIQACKVPPPSSVNPNVPKELDQIVLKALSKDREDRYKDMDQFNRALVKFLYANYPDFNASDLSYFAKELFKNDIEKDRAKLFEFGKIDIGPYLSDLKNESNGKGDSTQKEEQVLKKEQVNFDMDEGLMEESNKTKSRIFLENTSTHTGLTKQLKSSSSNKIKVRKSQKTQVSISKNNKKSSLIPMAIAISFIGVLVMNKNLVLNEWQRFCIANKICTTARTPSAVESELNGKIRLNGFREFHRLFINGEKVDYRLLGVEVPIGKQLHIKITQTGRRSYEETVTLSGENQNHTIVVPQLQVASFGEIYSEDKYPAGTKIEFVVGEQKVEESLPLRSYRLPAGVYSGVIKNNILGIRKEVQFAVEEDRKTELPSISQ